MSGGPPLLLHGSRRQPGRIGRRYRSLMTTVEAVVDAAAATSDFNGVVRVDRGTEPEWVKAYGLADRSHGISMTPDSQLAIASGSKTFTALAVMSLVQDGRLALSTTARSVLGQDLPLVADDVTVEHLLSMRSGIGDYLDEDLPTTDADYLMPVSVHLLATTEQYLPVLDGHPTKFRAGERFSYCNGGFVVLALIAERVSGVSFHELVRQRVLEPAAMSDTAFLRSDELPSRAARGYVQIDGRWRTNVFHLPVIGNGDGGIYTTARDISRFWEALFQGRIVSPPTLADMLTARGPSDPPAAATYCLGFWLDSTTGSAALRGSDAGVSFRSVHNERAQLTYTVMGNTSDGDWPVLGALADHFA